MKVDFDSPEFLAHMIEGQLDDIKCLRSQIEESVTICKEWMAILKNLEGQEKLLQDLKTRLDGEQA